MDNRVTSADVVFEYTGEGRWWEGRSVPEDITSVRFKEGLQKIEDWAFYNCSSLESITLPSTVTEMGYYAFSNCTNLREVIFNDGLKKIGREAFNNCTSLENIALPSTVTEIGDHAFNSCHNLREVTLNDGLQKIGAGALCDCTSLKSIAIPSTVTDIDAYAFDDCINLREVITSDGLRKIGECAFSECSSLESIKLPSTVTDIGNEAFCGCSNLREVELNGVPQNLKEAFHNCGALERFLFPTTSCRLENIIQTSHWEDLEDKLNEVRGVVQWESDELFVSRPTHHNWGDTKRDLGRISRLVSYYELKDATTTFELAMWKSKLDQADATNSTNRAAYRIDVPGPVKDTILQYLDQN